MIWKTKRDRRTARPGIVEKQRRSVTHESLERRELLAADPIHVGVVYIETDYLESDNDVGSDSRGDRFILSFTGGAPGTELNELRIRTDKDGDGISVGDPIFDTTSGGRGKGAAHDFQIVRIETSDGRTATARASVADGGQELILDLDNFRAGDRLEFTLDVDEVLRNSLDLAIFNDRLDVITSGQEFQDSILEAVFEAPHYESATADEIFLNDYGNPAAQFGLDLPPDEGDDIDSRPNRSAAAIASVVQTPKPVAIRGNVWLDNNLDQTRQTSEPGIENVTVSLQRKDDFGNFVDTGFTTQTNADGNYEFPKSLGLPPGEYQVIQTQPAGLFSVAAIPGSVNNQPTGVATSLDVISHIAIPLGDTEAIEMNFAEANAASIGGYVYQDDNNNGIRDPGESGIAGVTVRIIPVGTLAPQSPISITTDPQGAYTFDGLSPGTYELIEVNQPTGWLDGMDSAGMIAGQVVGLAENPGDAIRGIQLSGNDIGTEYNFGEILPGSIEGYVYLVAPGEDCDGPHDAPGNQPLGGVIVELQSPDGNVISRVTTTPMGHYEFDQIAPGEYRILQFTPDGLIDGQATVGTINGVTNGRSNNGSLISQIAMSPGGVGINYNFCEIAPATLSGYVYVDQSNDGQRDPGEVGIPTVEVTLIDGIGNIVDSVATDDEGYYEFTDLEPGTYTLVERHPDQFIDGIDSAGTIQGSVVGTAQNDRIRDIELPQGTTGVEYNFGELVPASLSGNIHVDVDGDCIRDPDEVALGDVTILLLDESGIEVARTTSVDDGTYRFRDLTPGRYSVVQLQPDGYFDGGTLVGTAGGVASQNRVDEIDLLSGENATDYDFCEEPPTSISGSVFIDQDDDCIRDASELGIEGVLIELRNDQGQIVATTTTDSDGSYAFEGLRAGEYSIFEHQPEGLFHGGQTVGSAGGSVIADDLLSVNLTPGIDAVDYNFCETEPVGISGSVFIDQNNDCIRHDGEAGIEGVLIELRDASGNQIATTTTDIEGNYSFSNLPAGDYQIFEHQPDGFFQGGQTVGTAGGIVLGVDLLSVTLTPGTDAIDYLFCEYEPGWIAGSVWSDDNQNSIEDSNENPIPNVVVKLIDDQGNVIQIANTDQDGDYRFENLPRGVYSVQQEQPTGFFHGGELVGTSGGTVAADDLIVGIELGGGVHADDYDFPEIPPAEISGYVFVDGAPIESNDPIPPEDLRLYRDGIFTSDDTPIDAVLIEIRDQNGDALTDDSFLDGDATQNTITTTDANGFYSFSGLRPGTYTLFQSQPESLSDSIDTAGTTGGLAVNVADDYTPAEIALIDSIEGTSTHDAILNVTVGAAASSLNNNFSEILVVPEPEIPTTPTIPSDFLPLPQQEQPSIAAPPFEDLIDRKQVPLMFTETTEPRPQRFFTEINFVAWHLSVINGGYPRGESPNGAKFRLASTRQHAQEFDVDEISKGSWRLMTLDGQILDDSERMTLGAEDATALVGDFNGDGKDEVAIFVEGHWYIDLNGNGVWDAGDLWILLGTDMDRPVVGDWDGDGKVDIGIYGRHWEGDPRRIRQDAGLPDPANRLRRYFENRKRMGLVSVRIRGREQERIMRLGREGTLRADAVDHVFQFGADVDQPVSGDWNGDGIDQIGTFRGGTWILDVEGDGRRKSDEVEFQFGKPGDQPIVGDFDGDGIDEVAVIRGGTIIIDSDGDRRMTAADKQVALPEGTNDSQPIVGDWDGDGSDELGFYDQAG